MVCISSVLLSFLCSAQSPSSEAVTGSIGSVNSRKTRSLSFVLKAIPSG